MSTLVLITIAAIYGNPFKLVKSPGYARDAPGAIRTPDVQLHHTGCVSVLIEGEILPLIVNTACEVSSGLIAGTSESEFSRHHQRS